jgi:hypothetical protein
VLAPPRLGRHLATSVPLHAPQPAFGLARHSSLDTSHCFSNRHKDGLEIAATHCKQKRKDFLIATKLGHPNCARNQAAAWNCACRTTMQFPAFPPSYPHGRVFLWSAARLLWPIPIFSLLVTRHLPLPNCPYSRLQSPRPVLRWSVRFSTVKQLEIRSLKSP